MSRWDTVCKDEMNDPTMFNRTEQKEVVNSDNVRDAETGKTYVLQNVLNMSLMVVGRGNLTD